MTDDIPQNVRNNADAKYGKLRLVDIPGRRAVTRHGSTRYLRPLRPVLMVESVGIVPTGA